MKNKDKRQISFFDEPEPIEFKLVPHAMFLSWSLKAQLLYCAARDRDSAKIEVDLAEWYLWRAELYERNADSN